MAGVFDPSAGAKDPQPCCVEEYPSAVARLIAHPTPHYVLFTADPDPATGRPWCSDCDRCLEIAQEVVKSTGGTLLEVEVGPRPVWKDPQHPFRHDPNLKLTGIPTLFKFEGGKPVERLDTELEKAVDVPSAKELISNFVHQSREAVSV